MRYFNAVRRDDGQLQLNDLRLDLSGKATHPDDYIFRFNLKTAGRAIRVRQAQGGPPDTKAEDMMMDLIERAQGLPAPTE